MNCAQAAHVVAAVGAIGRAVRLVAWVFPPFLNSAVGDAEARGEFVPYEAPAREIRADAHDKNGLRRFMEHSRSR